MRTIIWACLNWTSWLSHTVVHRHCLNLMYERNYIYIIIADRKVLKYMVTLDQMWNMLLYNSTI